MSGLFGSLFDFMTICEVGSEPDQFIPRLTQDLATATAFWSHVTGTGFPVAGRP